MSKMARIAGLAVLIAAFWTKPLLAAGINVVVTIKPVHALVSGVMSGIATPYLIVRGASSPHNHALKPSDARALQNAKAVFWVGEDLEQFLERPVKTLAKDARVYRMIDAPGIEQLAVREGGLFGGHDHHDSSKEHGSHEGKEHDSHKDHDHGPVDMHLWLNPENAKAMVRYITQSLNEADPDNAAAYAANAKKLISRLDDLDRDIAEQLSPLKSAGFFVFHDSYLYFEKRYGLSATGSITVKPDVQPGARRIKEIRKKITSSGARCVFSEPQFNPRIVSTITDGLDTRQGVLDPIGATLDDGPELYFTLIRNIASAFKRCLGA